MAGSVDIGTLSGTVELKDKTGNVLDSFIKRVEKSDTVVGGMGQALFAAAGVATASVIAFKATQMAVDAFFAAMDKADKIVDLSSKLDVSIGTIQRWGYVAEQTGTSADAFARATLKLGVNIENGSKKTREAIKDLGLGYEYLRGLKPEQQFDVIAHRLSTVNSNQERLAIGIALLGKGAGEVMPAINEGYLSIANSARVSGEEQIKSLANAKDAWDGFKTNVGSTITSFFGNMVIMFRDLTETHAQWEERLQGLGQKSKDPLMVVQTAVKTYVDQLNEAKKFTLQLSEATFQEIRAAKELGIAEEEVAKTMHISTEEVELANRELDKRAEIMKRNKDQLDSVARQLQQIAEEKMKKYRDALTDLNNAEISWQKTLLTVDGTIVEAIKYYMSLGVETDKLRLVYGLTEMQINAVAKAFDVESAAIEKAKQQSAAMAEAKAELAQLSRDQANALAGVGDRVIAEIQDYLKLGAALDTLAKAYGLTEVQVRAIQATLENGQGAWEKEKKAVSELEKKVRTLSGEYITLSEAKSRASQGGSFEVTSQNFIKAFTDIVTAGGFNPTGKGKEQYDLGEAMKLAEQGYSFQEIMTIFQNKQKGASGPIPPPQGPRIPGFKEGGVGDFGKGTLAVLHGKEAIVPLDKNRGMGNGVTNIWYVNGTGTEVARTAATEIMRQLKQHRQFPSA